MLEGNRPVLLCQVQDVHIVLEAETGQSGDEGSGAEKGCEGGSKEA